LTCRRIPEHFNLFQQSCGNLMPRKKLNRVFKGHKNKEFEKA